MERFLYKDETAGDVERLEVENKKERSTYIFKFRKKLQEKQPPFCFYINLKN